MKSTSKSKKAIGIAFAVIIAVSVFAAGIPSIASKSSNISTPTEPAMEIEALQQSIYDLGYNYTVAENWITRLSLEERKTLCGYKRPEAPTEPLPENIGFVSDVPKRETKVGSPPPSYDAMWLGHVTPVKDQSTCGSCWIFGAIAEFESDVAIDEYTLLDFSEQEAGDCNIWSRIGGYDFCNGGIALMTTNYFTKHGSADETCHPYAAASETCQECPLIKKVGNWRMITGSYGESQIAMIKNAILNYGPVYSTIYASDPGFHDYYSGVYEYWGTETPNHAVQIIGWNDSLGTDGAWMIKNSWGTGWGAGGPYPGCAWVAYGAANLGDDTSAISSYSNADSQTYHHDECGWMWWCTGCDPSTIAYGAVRFIPSEDSTLTAVDFWAVDVNMQYEIKVFDTISGGPPYTFSNQRGSTQAGSTTEQGYYSIPLDTLIPLIGGDDFIVQVKLTTTGWGYPIPIDYCTYSWLNWSTIATSSGESYASCDGIQFDKYGTGGKDIGIRARAGAEIIQIPYCADFENGTEDWFSAGFWNLIEHPEGVSVLSPDINPELVTLPDEGYLPSAQSGTHAWWYGEAVTGTYIGSDFASVWQEPKNGGESNGQKSGDLISPLFNLTAVTNATLSFDSWFEIESVDAHYFDLMTVLATIDNGASWTEVGQMNPQFDYDGPGDIPFSSGGFNSSGMWVHQQCDLTPFTGNIVKIRFNFDTQDELYNGFRGWLIDDLCITAGSVPTPDIDVDPASFDFTVPRNQSGASILNISNVGTGNLSYYIVPEVSGMAQSAHQRSAKKEQLAQEGWLSVNPSSGTVQSGSTDFAQVTVDANLPIGSYTGCLNIGNNDPDENPRILLVNLTVGAPEEEVFDTGNGTYPSIMGIHNGTITPNQTINVSKMYTYPCTGTGGHTEYVTFCNSTTGAEIANGTWTGYSGDWHNITFVEPFTLDPGEMYNYSIRTGSYPQIHHNETLATANGWINCTKFTDANGKKYTNRIPAIRLEQE